MGDGRTLIFGMDPTLTLCSVCREPISQDYTCIVVVPEIGRLTHGRCVPTNLYEQNLLHHPPIEVLE